MADSAWVGIIGIVSTGAVGVAGAYFAYKAQRTPLRQALYERQLNVLSDFSVLATRACKLAALLTDASKLEEPELRAVGSAWDEVQEQMLEVVQRGSIILPSTVYGAVTQVRFMADRFGEAFDEGVNVGKAYYELTGAVTQAGMVSRMLAGADALSTESLSLHSRNGYGAFADVGVQSMARLSRFFWGERRRKERPSEKVTDSEIAQPPE
ncbi:hypothetical protein H9654_00795 [Stenotrophomonas sp. Sa5BUN4]|uniref:DUF4760 domain-containing protein n=1 Tax=Stenotrophomonas lacuserhaii TaxID=2760084 RepID=A0A8X8K288_9GAMM|nr:hypothetical protein [Stenotrophomonas pennii]MBD7952729.1 hypothetical protein [Stenotrophomonas pennii]